MSVRDQRLADCQRLRAEGLKLREIGDRLGLAVSTVHTYLSDPDGSKVRARKAGLAGACVDCGAVTAYKTGGAAERCQSCAHRAQVIWTRETVVAAIQRFAERYGRAPVATDFNPHVARLAGHADAEEKFRRFYEDGDYPGSASVHAVFGGWNTAVRAAGFEPLPSGVSLADRERAAA